jgi:arsenate reductase
MKQRVLFICIHNSARSQMAEAFLKNVCGNDFEVHSAGLEPGKLNPVVVEVMAEIGIDISKNQTKAASDFVNSAREFDWVITVCDEASAERCPVFPGGAKRLHWGFPDPSGFSGSPDQKLEKVREVRDAIKAKVYEWCELNCTAAQ